MTRLLISVEGQTEENFVNDTLAPYLAKYRVYATPSLVWTRRDKSGGGFRGGAVTWGKIHNHLTMLSRDTDAWVTMIYDFYGLPGDCPGYQEAHQPGDPRQRVIELQNRIGTESGHPRLIPFFSLHELEAWLFCAPEVVAEHFGQAKLAKKIQEVVKKAGEPEGINHGTTTHPKAQLKRVFPGYREVADGSTLMGKIGIAAIQDACPHFAAWLDTLEQLGKTEETATTAG